MGEGKVADVLSDADAPEHQSAQQAKDTDRLGAIPVGKNGRNNGREGRGNGRTDTATKRAKRGVPK